MSKCLQNVPTKSLDQNVAQRAYFKKSVKCWWCVITAIIPYDLWGREDGNSKHPQACSYTMGCFMHCGAFWQEEPPKPKKPKKAGFFLEPAWVCWIWWFGTSLTLPLKHKAMRFGISSSMLCFRSGECILWPFPCRFLLFLEESAPPGARFLASTSNSTTAPRSFPADVSSCVIWPHCFFSLRIRQHRKHMESVGVSRRCMCH